MCGGEAGAYAGFMDWKKHGYSVKKGGRSVCIVQPIVHKDKEGNSEMVNVSYTAAFHFSQVQPMADTAQAELVKPANIAEVQTAEAVTEETPEPEAAAEVQPGPEPTPEPAKPKTNEADLWPW